jgi:hypothetical protein
VRAGLEGLPGVEEVRYLHEGDRFIVRYRGDAPPDLAGAAERRVLFPRLRCWLEKIHRR